MTALTLSTVVVKIIGMVYKIPMLHILGAEGMGYFNSAYELYAIFFVVATTGLPVAVSILVSEGLAHGKLRNVKRIYRVSFSLFLALGFLGSVVMAFFAKSFAEWLGSPDAAFSILLIAPTVFFVTVSGAVKGYFQGERNMVPTAISQVIEAVGKLLIGVVLAFWAVRKGWPPYKAAALAVLGLVLGSAISVGYLLIASRRKCVPLGFLVTETEVDSIGKILRRLFSLATPITVSALLSNITRIVDMSLILRRLTDIGVSSSVATAMFGSYSTLAVPIFHLPSALISGIAVSLVPSLTDAAESGSRERTQHLVGVAFRLCTFVAVPCSFGMAIFSRQILSLLFAGEAASVEEAVPLLSILGLSVLSSCLVGVTGAVLQAHKKASLPIVGMLVGAAVKILTAYLLIGIPDIGMMGAPISTLLFNTVAVALNFYFIGREHAFRGRLRDVMLKPILIACAAFAVAVPAYLLVKSHASDAVAFIVALVVCVALYLIVGVCFGALEKEDIACLPIGEKSTKWLFIIKEKKRKKDGKQTENIRPVREKQLRL